MESSGHRLRTWSDGQLAGLVRATGDQFAFSELVQRHEPALRRFLAGLRLDGAPADDLAQEAFMRAYDSIHLLADPDAFRGWLFRIGYRQALKSLRRSRRRGGLLAGFMEPARPAVDPDLSLDLAAELARLEPQERAAVTLCDVQGLAHTEAAQVMTAPLGSVKTWVRRGRAKMRAALEGDGQG